MKQIVLDSGPIIGLFHPNHPQHNECVAGFNQLQRQKNKLFVPIPIVFEVYKWLSRKVSPSVAQSRLNIMVRRFYLVTVSQVDLLELQAFITNLPDWRGTLEDAVVISTALRYDCPVWTMNYRDFSVFNSLLFWTPDIT